MDELAAMRVFAQVVESGSLSGGARKNKLSVATVSRILTSLEDELGVRLLNRSTRHLGLTEAGEIYHQSVQRILQEIDGAKRLVTSYQGTVKGNLRLHCRVSVGTHILAPALKTFLDLYPEVNVELTLTDERADLVADGVDCAVWLGNLPDSNLVARRLHPTHRIVCASPSYFASRGMPTSPEDLKQHNCILFKADDYGSSWRFQKGADAITVPVSGNLQTKNGAALLPVVLSGLGVGLLHEWMVRSHIQNGSLVRILRDFTVSPVDYDTALYAVYPHKHRLPLKMQCFLDFLVELFRNSGDEGGSQFLQTEFGAPMP